MATLRRKYLEEPALVFCTGSGHWVQMSVMKAVLPCTVPDHASHIPNFDLNVTTRSEERIWVNLSSISFLNRRTSRSLLVHLVRDINAQKKREEIFGRMVAISKEVANLEDAVAGAAPIAPLSSQELEILKMFAVGTTAPRIAKALGISPQTLRNHLHHINQKLRTHNRLEAVMHALQRRLI